MTGEREAAASGVAAGMLAPVTETTFTESALLGLSLASRERFDATSPTELEAATGLPSGLRREPTLSVATSADDDARLRVLADYLERLGLRLHPPDRPRVPPDRTAARARRSAPGLLVEGDWSCDNRLLWRALRTAATRSGVDRSGRLRAPVSSPPTARVTGVALVDGTVLAADAVVLANGAWAAQIAGVAAGAGPAGQGPDPAARSRSAAAAVG